MKLKELDKILYPEDLDNIALFNESENELCQGTWAGLVVGFGEFPVRLPISLYQRGGEIGAEITVFTQAVTAGQEE